MKNIAMALINAQEELKNPEQNKKGYGYKYADLPSLIDQTKPVLKKYGLAISQLAMDDSNGRVGVKTILLHESGETLESTLTLPIPEMKGNSATQQAGAAITYARRYAYSALLNLASEEDTDATKKASANNNANAQTSSNRKYTTNSKDAATDKQKGLIWGLIKDSGEDVEGLKVKVSDYLKIDSLKDMTKADASKAIKFLQDRGKVN